MKKQVFAGPLKGLAVIDKLVHEPARLLILGYLAAVDSADFVFLLTQCNLSRGNLSSHMTKLDAAGYVHVEKIFVDKIPRTVYRLTHAGRKAFKAYLEQMNRVLKQIDKI